MGKVRKHIRLNSLSGEETSFAYVEAFKTLRTNLEFLSSETDCKKIVVTSPLAEEGKTNVSINLAVTLADAGKKVILLDCDLRRSILEDYLLSEDKNKWNKQFTKGLSGILCGKFNLAESSIEMKNLGITVLPSGKHPPNPSELLASKKMGQLIQELDEIYDYIIFDAPPISLVTDAAVIGKYTDGALLVVRYKSTPVVMIKKAMENLNNAGIKVIGSILNAFDIKKSNIYGKKYYGYYRYAYKKEGEGL